MALVDIIARNDVLAINPSEPGVDIHLTDHGSSWLWAAFAIFSFFAVIHIFIYAFTSGTTNALKKFIFIYPALTNTILAVAYFTYASNLGATGVPVEFHHVSTSSDLGVRYVYYAKYIGWFLAWPFVLTLFEISTHTIVNTNENTELINTFISLFQGLFSKLLFTEIFVLGLLIGIFIKSSYKWGYFTFSLVGLLVAISLVSVNIHQSSKVRGLGNLAHLIIIFEIVVWILYPISWGLSEGGNVIQPDSEAVFYGVLDLITFSFVPTALAWLSASSVDEQFFSKLWRLKLNDPVAQPVEHPVTDVEKSIGETPRHSGDTAVPGNGITGVTEAEREETV